MATRHFLGLLALVACWPVPCRVAAEGLTETLLFRSGQEGYGRFRIPALLVTPRGTLLAFCEGRKKAGPLTGDIDLVLKRSFDAGRTWQPLQIVADDGPHTLGNPCPVVDARTGTIWLAFTRSRGQDREDDIVAGRGEPTTVWVTKSTDDGTTWAKAVEISATARRAGWTWYGTGPGVGLQLRGGRLLLPCYHAEAGSGIYRSHMVYSDDGGKTWQLGDVVGDHTSECQVVERGDGSVLVNCRSLHGVKSRTVATSADGGRTWSKPALDENLPEPDCQGCLHGFTDARRHDRNRWLFINPPGPRRENVTVRLSYDEGKTWPIARRLYQGPSAYTCLAVLPDLSLGCLYERGVKQLYEEVAFARFPLAWLTEGKDTLGNRPPANEPAPLPQLVGHRGLLRYAPENTLAGFAACLDLRVGFELDVRRTRDGHLVCLHDDDVKRTTNGTGKVSALTLAELSKLDAGSWFNPAFAGQHVPTLDEVFALLKGRQAAPVRVVLDLKIADPQIEHDIVRLAVKHGVLRQLLCFGRAVYDPAVRRRFRAADSRTPVAVLALTPQDLSQAAADTDSDWVYVFFLPTADQVARVHRAGKQILVGGTLILQRAPESWRRAREAKVDALLTDYPLECRQVWRSSPR
jgi:sialidase-1